MRYIHPKSLTWWAGVLSVATGMGAIAMPDAYALSQIGQLVGILAGGSDNSPAGLIALGLGLIGIRDKLERSMKS